MSSLPLASRHIVITGASRGIGRALSYACVSAGARVSICARSQASLEQVAAETSAVGGVLDVRSPDSVRTWIEAGIRQNGPIDCVVNNAAMLGPKQSVLEYPLETWREVIDINVSGVLVVSQACLPHLVRPGGALLHLTSYLGRNALPRYGAYCASKFAVEGLARLLHEEHHESEGLISVCVDPGMVQTEMLKAAAETDDVSEHTPVDVAAAAFVRVIAGLEARHSGQTLDLLDPTFGG